MLVGMSLHVGWYVPILDGFEFFLISDFGGFRGKYGLVSAGGS